VAKTQKRSGNIRGLWPEIEMSPVGNQVCGHAEVCGGAAAAAVPALVQKLDVLPQSGSVDAGFTGSSAAGLIARREVIAGHDPRPFAVREVIFAQDFAPGPGR